MRSYWFAKNRATLALVFIGIFSKEISLSSFSNFSRYCNSPTISPYSMASRSTAVLHADQTSNYSVSNLRGIVTSVYQLLRISVSFIGKIYFSSIPFHKLVSLDEKTNQTSILYGNNKLVGKSKSTKYASHLYDAFAIFRRKQTYIGPVQNFPIIKSKTYRSMSECY